MTEGSEPTSTPDDPVTAAHGASPNAYGAAPTASDAAPTTDEVADSRAAALRILRLGALVSAIAQRLGGDVESELLQSVVDAAAALFEAEASSIALFDAGIDRLVFRVAAGTAGAGVIGISVLPGQGIAGHVFSSRESLAFSDVASDPRFDVATARKTGYLPRSIAAVPLVQAETPIGVLQVLDKHDSDAFSPQDMRLLEVFARQAATAIEAARAGRDPQQLFRSALESIAAGELDAAGIEALLAQADPHVGRTPAATAAAAVEGDDGPFWRLVDQVAGQGSAAAPDPVLVAEVLDVVRRHRAVPEG